MWCKRIVRNGMFLLKMFGRLRFEINAHAIKARSAQARAHRAQCTRAGREGQNAKRGSDTQTSIGLQFRALLGPENRGPALLTLYT